MTQINTLNWNQTANEMSFADFLILITSVPLQFIILILSVFQTTDGQSNKTLCSFYS